MLLTLVPVDRFEGPVVVVVRVGLEIDTDHLSETCGYVDILEVEVCIVLLVLVIVESVDFAPDICVFVRAINVDLYICVPSDSAASPPGAFGREVPVRVCCVGEPVGRLGGLICGRVKLYVDIGPVVHIYAVNDR